VSTIERFDSGGLELVAQRWPAAGGAPAGVVLFLHGGGQTRHSWERTAERVAAGGWDAVALDLRGHGESAWDPEHDYSLDAFAGDLVRVIEELGTPPVLVGASLGGATGLVVAGEHPGLARGLVLVDFVVRLEPGGVDRIREFMAARPDGFATLDDVADAIAAYTTTRRRTRNLDGLRKNVRLGEDGRWHWHWDPAFMRIGDEPQREISPDRLRTAAAHVAVPTLLVRGHLSDVVSEDGVREMLALMPGARTVDVQSAGHMVVGDDNDVFGAALDAFLAELAAG